MMKICHCSHADERVVEKDKSAQAHHKKIDERQGERNAYVAAGSTPTMVLLLLVNRETRALIMIKKIAACLFLARTMECVVPSDKHPSNLEKGI